MVTIYRWFSIHLCHILFPFTINDIGTGDGAEMSPANMLKAAMSEKLALERELGETSFDECVCRHGKWSMVLISTNNFSYVALFKERAREAIDDKKQASLKNSSRVSWLISMFCSVNNPPSCVQSVTSILSNPQLENQIKELKKDFAKEEEAKLAITKVHFPVSTGPDVVYVVHVLS